MKYRTALNADVLQITALWCALKEEERQYQDVGAPSYVKGLAKIAADLADGSTFVGVLDPEGVAARLHLDVIEELEGHLLGRSTLAIGPHLGLDQDLPRA